MAVNLLTQQSNGHLSTPGGVAGRSRPHRHRRRDGAHVVLRIGYTGVTLTG
jgi:hypothetical protein